MIAYNFLGWCWRPWLLVAFPPVWDYLNFPTDTCLEISTLFSIKECKTQLTSAQDFLLGDDHWKVGCFNTKFRCLSVLLDLALGHQIRIFCLYQFIFFLDKHQQQMKPECHAYIFNWICYLRCHGKDTLLLKICMLFSMAKHKIFTVLPKEVKVFISEEL